MSFLPHKIDRDQNVTVSILRVLCTLPYTAVL